MSGNKKTSSTSSTNKKRDDPSNRTYTVERLLKQRKRKGRTEYLVKWKHYDKSHNSWEPETNILDKSLIESYKKQLKSAIRRSSSPKKSHRPQNDDVTSVKNDQISNIEENKANDNDDSNSTDKDNTKKLDLIDYWYPPVCEPKTKIAITDITSDNVTITIRELI